MTVSRWRRRVSDALLIVSFFFIGFFSVSGDGAASRDMTEMQKTGTPASAGEVDTQEAS